METPVNRLRKTSLRAMRAKANEWDFSDTSSGNGTSMNQDRRRNDRRPFPYKQCLAPIVSGQLPEPDMFREVRCHNLSSKGFSFQSADIPDYQQLLVAFGKQGSLIYLTASIVHVTPTTEDGADCYLVGCRYTGRTPYS